MVSTYYWYNVITVGKQITIKADHLMIKFLKASLFHVGKSWRFGNLQHFFVRENVEDYQILKIFRHEITKILKTSSLDDQLWYSMLH